MRGVVTATVKFTVSRFPFIRWRVFWHYIGRRHGDFSVTYQGNRVFVRCQECGREFTYGSVHIKEVQS